MQLTAFLRVQTFGIREAKSIRLSHLSFRRSQTAEPILAEIGWEMGYALDSHRRKTLHTPHKKAPASRFIPRTFLLWGNSADHWTTEVVKKDILWGRTRYAKHINLGFPEKRSPRALYISQDIYYNSCDWVLSLGQTNAFMRCLNFNERLWTSFGIWVISYSQSTESEKS